MAITLEDIDDQLVGGIYEAGRDAFAPKPDAVPELKLTGGAEDEAEPSIDTV